MRRTGFISGVSRHPWPWLLGVIPAVYLVVTVARLAVDVPFFDHWEFLRLLDKSYSGITLRDLWAQHNEHRPMFAFMIMIPLAWFTGWNTNYEVAASLIVTFGSHALLVRRMWTTGLIDLSRGWVAPALSLIVFSLAQQENWLWGFQLQIPLNVLAVVGGTVLLTSSELRPRHVAGAALLGIVSAYTFSNGIAFWVVGACVLFLAPRGKQWIVRALAAWVGVALLTTATYFYQWNSPLASLAKFSDPLAFLMFLLKFLGAPLANFSPLLAVLCGACGLAAQLFLILRLEKSERMKMVPFLALGLYALASAAITSVGRAGAGTEMAMASRYVTFAQFLWISIGACALSGALGIHAAREDQRATLRIVSRILLACILVGGLASTIYGTHQAASRSRYLDDSRALLLRYRELNHVELHRLSSLATVGVVGELAPLLERRRLSAFRNSPERNPRGRLAE